jgi:hypothetical protein
MAVDTNIKAAQAVSLISNLNFFKIEIFNFILAIWPALLLYLLL